MGPDILSGWNTPFSFIEGLEGEGESDLSQTWSSPCFSWPTSLARTVKPSLEFESAIALDETTSRNA